ncbi:GGDEF domain-containing protein [Catenovulum sp. 2E275]|uniref:GGDEF domain-containing protein n=1 Tax=Catenovulum sp. 2E275 TaxID=2980497 RepID=UPI0021CE5644|nr:GGDEF domain-containing protein [Catenovulum sp. 2E275]MCU4677257.1 GGDEF domain-containing protein [Catenovulum sp. 2E275]
MKTSPDLIDSINRLTKALYQLNSIDLMLSLLKTEINSVFGFNLIWLYQFVDNQKNQLKLISVKGNRQQLIKNNYDFIDIRQDKMLENILKNHSPVYIEDARLDSSTNKEIIQVWGNRTLINCQLFIHDKSIGIFGTGSFLDEGVKPLNPQQITYFNAITNALAIALDRLKYKTISMQDPLTNLDNKRALKIHADTILSLAQRNQHKVAVIFIDLDNFKPANDTFGHNFGDQVLKHFANRLTRVLRYSDIKIRYGGDEFVVILPEINDESSIKTVIDNIDTHCTDIRIGNIHYQLSFSAGWSVYPYDGQNIYDLIEQADHRMYNLKQ